MKRKIYQFRKKVSQVKHLCVFCICLGSVLGSVAQTIEREAESFDQSLYVTKTDNANYSGGAFLSMRGVSGSIAEYSINAPEAGAYDITFTYVTEDVRHISIQVNDQVAKPFAFTDVLGEGSWSGDNGTKDMTTQIYLDAGANTLRLGGYITWSPNIDKIKIEKSSVAFSKPATQITPIVLEAENADVITGTGGGDTQFKNFSGGAGAGGNSDNGFKLEFKNINVSTAGAYDIYIYYASRDDRSIYVKANDRKRNTVKFTEKTSGWGNDDHNDETSPAVFKIPTTVYFNAGQNKLTLGAVNGWTPNIDKIEIVKSGAQISDPGIEILASVFDYTDLATLSDNLQSSQASLFYLKDNNEHTVYTAGASEVKIVAELPYPIVLTGFAYATDVESPAENGWFLESSEDGQTWIFMTSINPKHDNGFHSFLTGEKPGNNANPAKYFRLTAKGQGSVNIGDWQLYGTPYVKSSQHFPDDLIQMVNGNYAGSLTATDTGFNSGGYDETFGNLLDKKFDTKYTVTGKRKGVSITYEFPGTTAIVKSYSLTVPYSNYSGRNPKAWKLLGLPADGDRETWVELDVRTEMKFPANGSTLILNVKNPTECIGYTLQIDDTAADNDIHLTQWQLFGESVLLTSIKPSEENSVSVFGDKNKIIISDVAEGEVYVVYDLAGKLIKTGVVYENQAEVAISAGVYIVRVNNIPTKVIVR